MGRAVHTGRAAALPLTLIAQAIPRLSRDALEGLAEALIDRLDEIDGDPDEEANGTEDDPITHWDNCGPGCPFTEPDFGVDDQGEHTVEDEGEPEHDLHPLYGIDQSQPVPEFVERRAVI